MLAQFIGYANLQLELTLAAFVKQPGMGCTLSMRETMRLNRQRGGMQTDPVPKSK
jgi:hypothetical protein